MLIKTAAENAEADIPEIMIENQIDQMMMEFENRLNSQGIDFSTFLMYSGQTPESFRETSRESAENNVRARLVLDEIAKQEGIEPDEADVDAEITRIAAVYAIEEEKMRQILRDEDLKGLKTDLRAQKALKVITESAVARKK